jgi:hypothetical protein
LPEPSPLANPQAAFAFELAGADPWGLAAEPPPRLASEEFAGEMTECYHLALARDVPYTRYGQEPVTAAAVEDLRRFHDYRDVDAGSLFRSTSRSRATSATAGTWVSGPTATSPTKAPWSPASSCWTTSPSTARRSSTTTTPTRAAPPSPRWSPSARPTCWTWSRGWPTMR